MDVTDSVDYCPTRKFNKQSLWSPSGESIIAKLSKIAKLSIIEDVDLTADYLSKHVQDNKLSCVVSAINIDARYSSQVFAICDRKYENILPGTKIC